MSESIRAMFDHLPIYWRLATIKCLIYCAVQMLTTFAAGLQGYQHWDEMNPIAKILLFVSVIVAGANSIITFLDQTMSKVAPKDSQSVTVTSSQTVSTSETPKV